MTGAIYKAIPAIIRAVDPVGKTSRNQQQGYMYRSADAICDALHDALGEHKVFTTCRVLDREVSERPTRNGGVLHCVLLKCVYSFHGEDGSHVDTESIGEGMDSGDKATNKAMTAAYKYALLQTFCMMGHKDSETDSPGHEDSETDSPKPARKVERPKPEPPRELTEDEHRYIADATETIMAATCDEELDGLAKIIANKSPAVRDKLAAVGKAKREELRTRPKETEV